MFAIKIRGGSWFTYDGVCRSAHRNGGTPTLRSVELGFRVAVVPSGEWSNDQDPRDGPVVRSRVASGESRTIGQRDKGLRGGASFV